MARIIKLTESDLKKLINSIIEEESSKKKVRPLNEGIVDTLYQIINGSDGPRNTVYRYINTCPNVTSSQTSGSNSLADRLYNAIDGAGTTESEVYEVFRALKSFEEFCSLKKSYENSYSESMWDALDGDFDMDSEWVQIMRPIRNLATTYYAKIRSNNQLSRTLDGMKTTTTTRPTPKPANQPTAKPTTTKPTTKPTGVAGVNKTAIKEQSSVSAGKITSFGNHPCLKNFKPGPMFNGEPTMVGTLGGVETKVHTLLPNGKTKAGMCWKCDKNIPDFMIITDCKSIQSH